MDITKLEKAVDAAKAMVQNSKAQGKPAWDAMADAAPLAATTILALIGDGTIETGDDFLTVYYRLSRIAGYKPLGKALAKLAEAKGVK